MFGTLYSHDCPLDSMNCCRWCWSRVQARSRSIRPAWRQPAQFHFLRVLGVVAVAWYPWSCYCCCCRSTSRTRSGAGTTIHSREVSCVSLYLYYYCYFWWWYLSMHTFSSWAEVV
ncbi:hypothetical protein F5H01DRAFT_129241 [Linnemannia elongata]|nr:hypothetical protein F5H01DRAFT_129241 [Linnemannia elongata]